MEKAKTNVLFDTLKVLRNNGLRTTHLLMALTAVAENEGTQADPICQVFNTETRTQTIAKLCGELEELGFVESRREETKQRANARTYYLSEKGRKLVNGVKQLINNAKI